MAYLLQTDTVADDVDDDLPVPPAELGDRLCVEDWVVRGDPELEHRADYLDDADSTMRCLARSRWHTARAAWLADQDIPRRHWCRLIPARAPRFAAELPKDRRPPARPRKEYR